VLKEFPLQEVLELACAAQRFNNEYLKTTESVFDTEGKFMYMKHANKVLVRKALKLVDPNNVALEFAPQDIFVEDADREYAIEIQKYFKRLMFAAVKGDNEFQMEVNSLLTLAVVPENKIGFIACLPSVYRRDSAANQIEKRLRTLDNEYLAEINSSIFDKDCEILASQRSKNFDAWNIDAIIDNKMVSWFSKVDMKVGPCVVIKGKVKDHSNHWKYKNPVTRLNYIKAVQ
jgi:hypothetical protein